jgi:DNA-binding ferritin-like protein
MYVKKSEYAKTIARNKELEEQNEAQYLVIKKLLKENKELKDYIKEHCSSISNLFDENEEDLYEDMI